MGRTIMKRYLPNNSGNKTYQEKYNHNNDDDDDDDDAHIDDDYDSDGGN